MSSLQNALESMGHPRPRNDEAHGPLPSLDDLIGVLEKTDPATWWAGPTFRSPDETQHCVLSHIFEMYGPDAMELFEAGWSTQFCIGMVNDGENPQYQQATAKDRSLAYLRALRDGHEQTTMESMESMTRDSGEGPR